MSPQTVTVLHVLLNRPTDWRYGYDLSRETGLKSGTLYPILIRLTERGWLEHEWRVEDGEKPRHLYRLTAHGRAASRLALKEHGAVLRPIT
ncbi:MAG TPA: helix-turn-helix transcriptional regulator, partial [Terriglobales bacterium]